MTTTMINYKNKGEYYTYHLGYLFDEKDWVVIKDALILYTNTVIDLEKESEH